MMREIVCKTSSKVYPIYIGEGAVSRLTDISFDRAIVITDDNCRKIYGKRLDGELKAAGIDYRTADIPSGERYKTLDTVNSLYSVFHALGVTKSDVIVAAGGGVTGDITAFAAATYLRGVRVVQIPTTLLAQVDSSVGGKCGVDMPFGKNLVGCIVQPEAVLIDPTYLATLPEREYACGMAEVIKCGVSGDTAILDALKEGAEIADIIAKTVDYKRRIVESDECESGRRMMLNFGHTVGHAIELLGNYEKYTHGEAVSIGMMYALRMSERMLGLSADVTESVKTMLERYGLPAECGYTAQEIAANMAGDKKRRGDKLNFVLVPALGRAEIVPLDADRLAEYLI